MQAHLNRTSTHRANQLANYPRYQAVKNRSKNALISEVIDLIEE